MATRAALGGFIIFLLKCEESKVCHIADSLREKCVSALARGREIPDLLVNKNTLVWTNTKTSNGKRLFVVFFLKFFIQNLVDPEMTLEVLSNQKTVLG